ncbi:MAG TPA: hypothetical protein VFL81_01680 [Candidatus Saccharimonadales bacterium]|nr:hypothetical protein [Candidatus Saccharimonadales bacterium]
MPTSSEKLGPAGGPPVRLGPGNHPPLNREQRRQAGRKKGGVRKDVATTTAEVPDDVEPQSARPVPKMGFPAFWYGVMRLFNENATPPKLGRKEREVLAKAYDEALAEEAERQEAQWRIDVRNKTVSAIRDLSNQVTSLVFGCANTKGAGACTTTMVYLSTYLAEISRVVTLLVDGNQAAGTCAARLDIDYGETITTQELADSIGLNEVLEHRDFKQVISRARPSDRGVRVISAIDIADENTRLTGSSTARVLELGGLNSEYMGVDTPNDITDTVSREIFAKIDVFIFTAYVGIPDSLRKIATSMETLRRLGFGDKVDNSIVVICGLQPDEDLDYYRMYLNKVSYRDEVTERLDHKFKGQFLGIPHDPYVRLDQIVDIDKLAWETQQAYIDLLIAMFEQSPKLRAESSGQTFASELRQLDGVMLSDERRET